MSEQSRFTPDEWQTLQFAPFWIFSAVLGKFFRTSCNGSNTGVSLESRINISR